MLGSVTPTRAVTKWLSPLRLSATDLTATPARFSYYTDTGQPRVRPHSHDVLALTLAIWIRRHQTANIFPIPGEYRQYCGRYHVHGWKGNAERNTTIRAFDRIQQPSEGTSTRTSIYDVPRTPIKDVISAWRTTLSIDTQTEQPLAGLKREADQLSWDDLLALALAHWLTIHPYALVVPTPLDTSTTTDTSPYHPQSWTVNADSPFTDPAFVDPALLGPPERVDPAPPSHVDRSRPKRVTDYQDQRENDTALDPFDEFRS